MCRWEEFLCNYDKLVIEIKWLYVFFKCVKVGLKIVGFLN